MLQKVITAAKEVGKWVKQIASEANGHGSSSRIIGLLVAGVCMGVLIAHVHMNRGLPSSGQMYGMAALVAAGVGAYAANRMGGKDHDGDHDGDHNGDSNGNP